MTPAVAIGPIQWYRPVVRISPLIASALWLMAASSATAATFTLDPVLVADMRAYLSDLSVAEIQGFFHDNACEFYRI